MQSLSPGGSHSLHYYVCTTKTVLKIKVFCVCVSSSFLLHFALTEIVASGRFACFLPPSLYYARHITFCPSFRNDSACWFADALFVHGLNCNRKKLCSQMPPPSPLRPHTNGHTVIHTHTHAHNVGCPLVFQQDIQRSISIFVSFAFL